MEWVEGIPIPADCGSERALLAPSVGSGVEPDRKSNLAKSECQKSHLVARISRNLNRSMRHKKSVEVLTVSTSVKLTSVS